MLSLWDLYIVPAVCFPLCSDYDTLGLYVFIGSTGSHDLYFVVYGISSGFKQDYQGDI